MINKKTDINLNNYYQNYDLMAFANVNKTIQQNVKKGISKSYIQYTKENLRTYIKNPASYITQIREVSNYIWRVSQSYKKIIEYYANMPLYSYNIYEKMETWGNIGTKDWNTFQDVCKRIYNLNIKTLAPQIISKALRDGIYVGFTYDDGNENFYIQDLDPNYCRIESIEDRNTYKVWFDASFFKQGNNKELITGIEDYIGESEEGIWDEVFVDGFNKYDTEGNDYRWFELPSERVICVISGDDPTLPLPYFLPVFNSLLDLLDYELLIRAKTELENTVIIVNKVPLLPNADRPDQFAVNTPTVLASNDMVSSVAPSLAGVVYSPLEIQPIFFRNENQVNDTNIYSDAITNLMKSLGVTDCAFNGKDAGAIGTEYSMKVDESLSFILLNRLGNNIQRYMKLNISENYLFKFHQVSTFSKNDYLDNLKEKTAVGLDISDYATVEKEPLEAWNDIFSTASVDFSSLLKPLATSHTMTNEGGAPNKKSSELSEEGDETRNKGKNKQTKARKQ